MDEQWNNKRALHLRVFGTDGNLVEDAPWVGLVGSGDVGVGKVASCLAGGDEGGGGGHILGALGSSFNEGVGGQTVALGFLDWIGEPWGVGIALATSFIEAV